MKHTPFDGFQKVDNVIASLDPRQKLLARTHSLRGSETRVCYHAYATHAAQSKPHRLHTHRLHTHKLHT